MTEDTIKILDEIRPELQRVLPKGARVLLFGSRARGDNRPDSDFDLLVLLDHEGRATDDDFNKVIYPMYMTIWNKDVDVDILHYTNNEWQSKKGKSLLYYNVTDEAVEI